MEDLGLASKRKRPAARGGTFYPRKRANVACQVCRARKTKCDNRKPSCSYCLSVGAICTQSTEDLSSFDPASLKIIERLDVLEKLVRQQSAQSPQQQQQQPHSLLQAEGHVSSPSTSPSAQHPSGSSRDRSSLDNTKSNEFVSSHSSQRTFTPSGYGAKTSPLNVLPTSPAFLLRLPVFQNDRLGGSLLVNNDLHERWWTEKRQQQPHSSPIERTPGGGILDGMVGSCGGVDELLDRFFKFVLCKNPILKEAPTRHLVLSKSVRDIDGSAQSCLVFLVCALGRLAKPFDETPNIRELDTGPGKAVYAEAEALFQEAQRRMGALFVDNGGDHLIAPQCLLLSGFYMMCMFRPFMAWRFFVQALATCQQFDFLRDMYSAEETQLNHDTESQRQVTEEDSQEQAVYWTAWKSERELRRCLCLPDFPATGDNSHIYPPLFPTPPFIASNNSNYEGRERASWLFYLAEISLRRLLSSMCDEILSLHHAKGDSATFLTSLATLVVEYEQQGCQWAAGLPAELSLESPPESDDICRFVLRGHYIDYCEAIYWPFLETLLNCSASIQSTYSSHSPLSQPNVTSVKQGEIASDASLAVPGEGQAGGIGQFQPSSPGAQESLPVTVSNFAAKCLEIQIQRTKVNYPGFQYRHHAAALTGLPMPPGWQESIADTTGLLEFWEADMPQLVTWREFMTSIFSRIPETSSTRGE
ncbi:unnamed protein product [Penicillium pancosmium]